MNYTNTPKPDYFNPAEKSTKTQSINEYITVCQLPLLVPMVALG